jgi:hypothetical protein
MEAWKQLLIHIRIQMINILDFFFLLVGDTTCCGFEILDKTTLFYFINKKLTYIIRLSNTPSLSLLYFPHIITKIWLPIYIQIKSMKNQILSVNKNGWW